MRALAEHVATHPRIEQAVMGAIRPVLTDLIEQWLVERAETQGGTLRMYQRKLTQARRQERDDRLRALISAGVRPEDAARQVGCSRRHAYHVRRGMCKTQP